jgi:hypothetical protein
MNYLGRGGYGEAAQDYRERNKRSIITLCSGSRPYSYQNLRWAKPGDSESHRTPMSCSGFRPALPGKYRNVQREREMSFSYQRMSIFYHYPTATAS